MQIIRGEVTIRLPVVCCNCNSFQPSEPITVDISGLDSSELASRLNRVRIGTAFPVGWASYLGGKYRCPKCVV